MNSFVFYISIMIIFDIASVVSARFWTMYKNPWLLVMAGVFFAFAGLCFAFSMQFKGLAIANVFWTSLSVILTTAVSYFLFKEEIATVQYVGIVVIIIGLTLVSLK